MECNNNPRGNMCEAGSNGKTPDKLIFICDWYDREADLVKKYMTIFYTVDGTLEIIDVMNHRKFLRRIKVDTVRQEDLYLGNILNIYARHMTLIEYGDQCTKDHLEPKTQRAFVMIQPDAVQYLGFILQRIEKCFRVMRAKTGLLGFETACKFFQDFQGEEFYSDLVNYMSSAPVAAFVVLGDNAIERMKYLAGPKDPAEAKVQDSNSLRSLYGTNVIRNGIYVSEDSTRAKRDAEFFFPMCREQLQCVIPNTPTFCDTTCCIIKPHAVKEGLAGRIIADICSANFKVTAMELFYLDRTHTEEFYEIYKGVLAEYAAMTEELALGPCYVLEISGCDKETQKSFRSACGPMDPELGRKLRPQSLRARYGVDKVHNAVHCTDLLDDTKLELEYFFRILSMRS